MVGSVGLVSVAAPVPFLSVASPGFPEFAVAAEAEAEVAAGSLPDADADSKECIIASVVALVGMLDGLTTD